MRIVCIKTNPPSCYQISVETFFLSSKSNHNLNEKENKKENGKAEIFFEWIALGSEKCYLGIK